MSSIPLSADQHPSRRKTSAPDGAALERQLGRWIAEGDEAALAELFDLVSPTLYAVALAITHDSRSAGHALEHAFGELWDRRASLGRLPALSPWLLDRCRIWALASKNGVAAADPKPISDVLGDIPLTRRLLRCPPGLRSSRVTEALAGLDSRDRDVLLAVRAGLDLNEVAAGLRVDRAEVNRLLLSSLRSLRGSLERTLRRETP